MSTTTRTFPSVPHHILLHGPPPIGGLHPQPLDEQRSTSLDIILDLDSLRKVKNDHKKCLRELPQQLLWYSLTNIVTAVRTQRASTRTGPSALSTAERLTTCPSVCSASEIGKTLLFLFQPKITMLKNVEPKLIWNMILPHCPQLLLAVGVSLSLPKTQEQARDMRGPYGPNDTEGCRDDEESSRAS
jgi:hypothetical protein